MTDELRALALAVSAQSPRHPCVREYKCVSEEAAAYIEAADPQTILSLLDRLQAAERIPREPTPEMVNAVLNTSPREGKEGQMPAWWNYPGGFTAIWRAMYDAAQGAQDTPGDA